MDNKNSSKPLTIMDSMVGEDQVKEKTDKYGNRWVKVYVGGGSHFKRWLDECRELGEIEVEEIPPVNLKCYENAQEKMYRIWLKKGSIK